MSKTIQVPNEGDGLHIRSRSFTEEKTGEKMLQLDIYPLPDDVPLIKGLINLVVETVASYAKERGLVEGHIIDLGVANDSAKH